MDDKEYLEDICTLIKKTLWLIKLMNLNKQ